MSESPRTTRRGVPARLAGGLTLLGLALAWNPVLARGDAPAARHDAVMDAVTSAWRSRTDRCRSIRVKYERAVRGVVLKPTPGSPVGTRYDTAYDVTLEVAGNRFRQRTRSLHGSGTDFTMIFDGEAVTKFWPKSRTATRKMTDLTRPTNFRFEYTGNQAIWLFSPPITSDVGDAYFLPGAFEARPYEVLADTEFVDGVECVVLRSDRATEAGAEDTLWLDPSRGWILLKRVTTRATDPVAQDARATVRLGGYEQVETGLWMPMRLEIEHSRRVRGQENEYAPLVVTKLSVRSLSLGKIAPSVFVADLPPGTLLENLSDGSETMIPGGNDFLRTRVAALSEQYFPHAVGTRRTVFGGWLVAGLMAASVIGFIACRSRWPATPLPS